MAITQLIKEAMQESLAALYGKDFQTADFQINQTKPEFEGDYTVVMFSLVKTLKRSPETLGSELGDYLLTHYPHLFSKYNIIKGFLNLEVADAYWISLVQQQYRNADFGKSSRKGQKVMVEYSSPNTNKPLHLGHLRNNFLGWSTAEILKVNGYDIVKSCIVNDRGIHICKSMIAWQLFADGATPESTQTKGDHFVGHYYVLFNEEYNRQVAACMAEGLSREEAEKEAPIMKATQQMLLEWEQGNGEVRSLWQKMNSWVYDGFDITYRRIGSDFDKVYYESETYLPGKSFVEEGLKKGVFTRKVDGSVWIDLTEDGLDEKLLLRRDGTSVYMTQDIGLAQQKYDDFGIDRSIYVIADEQNYHMKVLKLICQHLKMPYADSIYHLSYGMVELTTGKMKSREGTVVDADDLIEEMVKEAGTKTAASGKAKDFSAAELVELYEMIGIGAMKFYLLRVDPKKRMVFNPDESIDLHGFTATSIQYTHARIKSVLRTEQAEAAPVMQEVLLPLERDLMILVEKYPSLLAQAGEEMNPSILAVYAYELAKKFNSFYDAHSILKAESPAKKQLRLQLAQMTANIIASAMQVLGIRVPERM